MSNNEDLFDKHLSLDTRPDELMEVVKSDIMELEEKREELIYLREKANANNKIACYIGFIGILVFIALSFSGFMGIGLVTLTKGVSILVGGLMSIFLLMSLFFTFHFSLGYIQLKKSSGVAVSGALLFCLIPFISIFVLAAIPAWNRFITGKLNKLFVEGGLEPVLVTDNDNL